MLNQITAEHITGLKPKHSVFVVEYMKDFATRRAAEASGYAPEYGHTLLKKPAIEAAINRIVLLSLNDAQIDATWLMHEMVDNHRIARQHGNITASNTALGMLGKHKHIDAYAADKVELTTERDVMERLMRGRKRAAEGDEPSFM